MTKFGAILGTRDEIDILPAAIEHLRRIGVEMIWVLDGGSTDGTLEYLAQAESESPGDLWLWHSDPSVAYSHWYRLALDLACAQGVDWLLITDCDEFLLPRSGSLHSLPDLAEADMITVLRYNVILGAQGAAMPDLLVPEAYDEVLVHAQPFRRAREHFGEDQEARWIEAAQEPKVLLRPAVFESLIAGHHNVVSTRPEPWRRVIARDAIVAHAPLRSLDRFRAKVSNIRESLADYPDFFDQDRGWHWSRWGDADDDGIRAEFSRQCTSEKRLASERESGAVRSVREVLDTAIPAYRSQLAYDEAVHRYQPWVMAAANVCRIEGIKLGPALPNELPDNVSMGSTPEVSIPPHHRVRFFSKWSDGHDQHAQHLWLLDVMGRDEQLLVERLLAHGSLDGEWDYIVVTGPGGEPVGDRFGRMGPRRQASLADALGVAVHRLHRVSLSQGELEDAESRIAAVADDYLEAAVGRVRAARLLPDTLMHQLRSWLARSIGPLGVDGLVLTHGALDREHILGVGVPGRGFELSGLARPDRPAILPHMYDLGPIWADLFRCDRALLWRFLDAADLPGRDEPGFPSRALAWALINPGADGLSDSSLPDAGGADDLEALAARWFDRPA